MRWHFGNAAAVGPRRILPTRGLDAAGSGSPDPCLPHTAPPSSRGSIPSSDGTGGLPTWSRSLEGGSSASFFPMRSASFFPLGSLAPTIC